MKRFLQLLITTSKGAVTMAKVKKTRGKSPVVKAAWFVQVWLNPRSNTDSKDVMAGGSVYLGPYCWVLENHLNEFQTAIAGPGNNVVTTTRKLVQVKKLPTLKRQLKEFREYMSDSNNW